MPRKSKTEAVATLLVQSEMAKAIGYVTANWGMLEAVLFTAICTILDIPLAAAAIMLAEVSMIQRLAIISALVHHSRKQDWFDIWDTILKRIEPLRGRRNNVVHGFWRSKTGEHSLWRVKSRGKLSNQKLKMTVAEVKSLYVAIAAASSDVERFVQILEIEGFKDVFLSPKGPVLDRTQSQQARAQAQARAQKKSKRPVGPEPRTQPKLSSAQKRALREAENHKKDEKP